MNTEQLLLNTYHHYLNKRNKNEDNLYRYIDFPAVIADLHVKLLFGKSFSFSTEDEKLREWWNDFVEQTRFQIVVEGLIRKMALYGSTVLGFTKLENKEHEKCKGFRIFTNKPRFLTQIVWEYQTLKAIWFTSERMTDSLREIFIRESWNSDGQVRRQFFGSGDMLQAGSHNTKIGKNKDGTSYVRAIQIRQVGELQEALGKNEAWESKENPFKDNHGDYIIPFVDFSLWHANPKPPWLLAKGLIDLYCDKMDFYKKELKTCKTIISINLDKNKAHDQIKKDLEANGELKNHIIVNTGGNAASDSAPVLESFQPQKNWKEFDESIDSTLSLIWSLMGFSWPSQKDTSTATEARYNYSNQGSTIQKKKTALDQNLNIFLDLMFQAAGFQDPQFTFELHDSNSVIIDEVLVSIMQQLSNYNWISDVDAIAKIFNMPIHRAQEKLDAINEKRKLDWEANREFREMTTGEEEGPLSKQRSGENGSVVEQQPKGAGRPRNDSKREVIEPLDTKQRIAKSSNEGGKKGGVRRRKEVHRN